MRTLKERVFAYAMLAFVVLLGICFFMSLGQGR